MCEATSLDCHLPGAPADGGGHLLLTGRLELGPRRPPPLRHQHAGHPDHGGPHLRRDRGHPDPAGGREPAPGSNLGGRRRGGRNVVDGGLFVGATLGGALVHAPLHVTQVILVDRVDEALDRRLNLLLRLFGHFKIKFQKLKELENN